MTLLRLHDFTIRRFGYLYPQHAGAECVSFEAQAGFTTTMGHAKVPAGITQRSLDRWHMYLQHTKSNDGKGLLATLYF